MANSDNNEMIGFIASTVETLRGDLTAVRSQMATKAQLDVSTTAIRGDIEQVHMRLDSMEHSLTSRFEHVEGELSRLRSAVYMLSKDRPEVLRLLGHNGG
jgi:hypothetical protein